MKKTLISAVLAATFGLVAMQASASDGTITFNGTITDTTCTVTGGGAASGQGNITVKLPTVSTGRLPIGMASPSMKPINPCRLIYWWASPSGGTRN